MAEEKAQPKVSKKKTKGKIDIQDGEYQLTHPQTSPSVRANNAQIPQNCKIAVSKKSPIRKMDELNKIHGVEAQ